MAQNIQEWSAGLAQNHVDPSNFVKNQNYVSAESIVVAVRPIKADEGVVSYGDSGETYDLLSAGTILEYVAIGTVQNISISQQRPSTQLWELGSRFSYFVPGRNQIQANLTKVVLNGNSLLKTLYPGAGANIEAIKANDDLIAGIGENNVLGHTIGAPGGKFGISTLGPTGMSIAGEGYFFSNLASELFNFPMDILLMILDSEGDPVHGMVLKQCYVQAHQMGAAAQQMVLVENVSIRCVRILPLSAI